jgi:hypothetical protein
MRIPLTFVECSRQKICHSEQDFQNPTQFFFKKKYPASTRDPAHSASSLVGYVHVLDLSWVRRFDDNGFSERVAKVAKRIHVGAFLYDSICCTEEAIWKAAGL